MPRLGLLRVFISVCYPQQRAAGLCVCVCVCVCVHFCLSLQKIWVGSLLFPSASCSCFVVFMGRKAWNHPEVPV